jgi:hypothetical protein
MLVFYVAVELGIGREGITYVESFRKDGAEEIIWT